MGINLPVPVSVSNGEYSINGGPFTSAPGTIVSGQKLRVRLTAAAQTNTLTTMTATVGERTASFSVGTAAAAFPQPTGAPLIVLRSHDPLAGTSRQTVLSDATFWTMRTDVSNFEIQARNPIGQNQYMNLHAAGAGSTPLVPGTFPSSSIYASDGLPIFEIYGSSDLLLCNYGTMAAFVVHEVEYSAMGHISRLALDFKQVCNVLTPTPSAVYGYVRYNSAVPIDYNIQLPVRFKFPPVIGVTPGTLAQSGEIVVQGTTVPVAVVAAGGEVSIDGGPFASTSQQVLAGQKVRVRAIAPATENAILKVPVTIGEGAAEFMIATSMGLNPQPGGNSLVVLISQGADAVGAAQSYVYSPAILATINTTLDYSGAVSVTMALPGEYFFPSWHVSFTAPNGAPLTAGTFINVPRLGTQSAAEYAMLAERPTSNCINPSSHQFTVHEVSYSSGEISSLAIDFIQYCGGSPDPLYGYVRVNSSFPISQIADTWPTPFFFPSQSGVPLDEWVISQSINIGGINGPVSIAVADGEYSIAGGPFTAASGIYVPGQSVRVRVRASALPSSASTVQLTVGGVVGIFMVQTPATYFLAATISGPGSVESDPSGISCTSSCWQSYNAGTNIYLTGSPGAGAVLTGWLGCTSITQANHCQVALKSNTDVTALFAATAVVPAKPVVLSIVAGDGQARIVFAPVPASVQPIAHYSAICNPGNLVFIANGSPMNLIGLTNGTTYTCRIAASNSVGTGALSDPAVVTPGNMLPLTLVSVQSRKIHANAGPFDLPLDFSQPVSGNLTIEPRLSVNGHMLVFQFNRAVLNVGPVVVHDSDAQPVGSVSATIAGADVLVSMSGVADNTRLTVTLFGVNGSTNASVSLGLLAGDSSGSGTVTAADIMSAKARIGTPVNNENFRFDMDLSGVINSADVSIAKARTGVSIR